MMKIVLVMVACFAAVQCQNVQCIIDRVSANPNLQSCVNMLVEQQTNGTFNVQAFCGLSCLGDLRTIYDTCGFSPNPVEAREFVLMIKIMHAIACIQSTIIIK